jgi:triacylglycerol lipase
MSSNANDPANQAAPNKTASAGTIQIDPGLTATLAAASVAAYNDFQNNDNCEPLLNGYTFFGRFSGWDDWFSDIGVEERFGLIFQSQTDTGCFVVAFRGTDSDWDLFEDAFFDYSTFQPDQNSVSPIPDDVSAGFNDIYSKMGGSMTSTMQQQIFSLLPQQISQVYVTGHSLGGALSQLFTLDMCVSLPSVNVQTINFASPKVGGSNWATACANAGAAQRITRVINYWDYVPSYPLHLSDEYVSLGAQFETAFYGDDFVVFDELHRHRLLNLQLVLTNCLPLNPQIWVGTFYDAVDPSYEMESTTPPDTAKDEMLAKLRELDSLERSIRPENSRSGAVTRR